MNFKEMTKNNKNFGKEDLEEKQIRNLLYDLYFNITTKGYIYVIEGIKLAYKDRELLYPIKNLYIEIGKKYDKNFEEIYRSIAISVDGMNKRIPTDELRSFFHTDYTKVSTKESLVSVVDYFLDE